MSDRPRLLDLFCGAGGAGEGYRRAGFDVLGVDIRPMPRNPHTFIQGDALEYLEAHGHEFDAIHASPPCQGYSSLRAMHPGRTYPMLIEPVRELLKNVPGAPLQTYSDLFGNHGVMLCGSMFGLGVDRGYLRRHRNFETSFPVEQPHCQHPTETAVMGIYGEAVRLNGKSIRAVGVYGRGGHSGKHRMLYKDEASAAMDITWMNRDEMCQAIPPAYTEFIGAQLLKHLQPAFA